MRHVSSETLGWLLWGTMIGLGVAGVVAAGLALSGRWRRWVFFPRMLLSVVPFTTFPLVSGFMGLGLVFLALSFVAGPGGSPGTPRCMTCSAPYSWDWAWSASCGGRGSGCPHGTVTGCAGAETI